MPIDTVDFTFPDPNIHQGRTGIFWTTFFNEHVERIFEQGGRIIDIGGGLRIDPSRGNKLNEDAAKRFAKYIQNESVDYKVTDYTDQYSPDYVEDIHKLSFYSESIDGLFCIAVLEHVYDPKKAAEEVVRVLKKGGQAFLYVPFIYRYHANSTGDYRDYFRYSKDGIGYLFRTCSSITICPVRGLFESLLRFTPLHLIPGLAALCRIMDWSSRRMRTISERQASGYFVHLVK